MTKTALVQFLSEFAPVFVFFIAGQIYDFFTATAILVVLTIISVVVSWHLARSIPVLPVIAGLFVVVSGTITVHFHEPNAIIFADTLYYLLFGIAIGASLLFQKNLLEWLFSKSFAMQQIGWRILAERWAILFLIAAIANEFVRLHMSPEFWVDYRFMKVVIIGAFGCYQILLARRYRIPEESNKWGLRIENTTT